MQAVRERSAGQVPLRTGSFYRHLAQLIDDGLVGEAAGRPADDDPRRGTYYRLTARGHRALTRRAPALAAWSPLSDGLQAPRRGPA